MDDCWSQLLKIGDDVWNKDGEIIISKLGFPTNTVYCQAWGDPSPRERIGILDDIVKFRGWGCGSIAAPKSSQAVNHNTTWNATPYENGLFAKLWSILHALRLRDDKVNKRGESVA